MSRGWWLFIREAARAVQIDSPITIGFVFVCFVVHCANTAAPGLFICRDYFGIAPYTHFRSTSVLSWFSLFSHVIGHSSWAHLQSNVFYLLLVSPAVERHHGGPTLAKILVAVALVSALAHMAFGEPNAVQLGSSGLVFSLILLNSLIAFEHRGGKIPLTFILQIFFWVWNEVPCPALLQNAHTHTH